MPFPLRPGKKRRASDADYTPSSSVAKQIKMTRATREPTPDPQPDESDDVLPPSSAPASPVFWDENNLPIIDDTPIRAPSPFELDLPPLPASPSPETPPTSPARGPYTSPFKSSPEKVYGGRPRVTKPHRNGRGIRAKKQTQEWIDLKEAQESAVRVQANMLRVQEEKFAAEQRDQAKQNEIFDSLKYLTSDGTPMHKVFELLFSANAEDYRTTAVVTRVLRSHGTKLLEKWTERAPEAVDTFLSARVIEEIQHEGRAIQSFLTREPKTQVTHLLSSFDMKGLGSKLKELAPMLWDILAAASTTHNLATEAPETRRDRSLVFTTVCAMISILRSQKANNFQAVIALFLLGSGASKRETEVFAHAGISLSYKSVMNYLDTLSQEGVLQFRAVWRECMCSLVWDNLNIAFRVESQRLDNKNHFDNGTTATLIPIYNPFTNEPRTARGTLPLSMKRPRTSTMPTYSWTAADTLPSPSDARKTEECLIWQLKSIALEHIPEFAHLKSLLGPCPEVDQIQLHKTEQFPLPAMHEDESSLEGTITVITKLLEQLQTSSEDLKDHGLVFANGDLLTDNLINTVKRFLFLIFEFTDDLAQVEGSRRNSTDVLEGMQPLVRRLGIFHAKMAGCRLVVNEHWGKPNATIAGGLCWEHTQLLQRKPISAGWKSKKAAPWKPSHELLQISSAGHVRDAFRIHCGNANFAEWAAQADFNEFNAVAGKVYDSLYTTTAYDAACDRGDAQRDAAFENSVLYNRDSLLYLLLVSSIKAGDIGCVVLVFRIWAVMMRSPKTMPKYADAFFETLNRIKTYDPVLQRFFLHNWLVNLTGLAFRFKEVDLLQEHQNFWAKIVYNAKGVNRSWTWLARITVCIFALRDAMKTVHATFKIPDYGTKHTVPDMQNEIRRVAERTVSKSYGRNGPGRIKWCEFVIYLKRYTLIPPGSEVEQTRDLTSADGDDDENTQEDHEATQEDLEMDDEEPYEMLDSLLGTAEAMADEMFN
ncbi:hypothetical protein MSAN_02031500 [Mycena sanguinolenta]|uniref:DUF6589 domain-containing protein n=1 Tax=Mycena sanguinolenta TaxID=230812 RepID=A0A8H7CMT0_9AGAR|nr:hypothetical protein MSAN_02031500 [Mycena sanguinolenta]